MGHEMTALAFHASSPEGDALFWQGQTARELEVAEIDKMQSNIFGPWKG